MVFITAELIQMSSYNAFVASALVGAPNVLLKESNFDYIKPEQLQWLN